MQQLPLYIPVLFILTVLLALYLLYRAGHYAKPLLLLTCSWLLLQTGISLTGVYAVTTGQPPRFSLALFPPLLYIILLFLMPRGRRAIDMLDQKTLTLIHVVRIPVELVLLGLYLHKAVPRSMTFEGHNWDILSGLSAPVIYYLVYVRKSAGRNLLLAWNIVCLLLLANIVITAILSAPFAFQRLAFDQPNVAMLYFPFVLLPAFVVPLVLFAHLAAIRNLLRYKKEHQAGGVVA